MARPARPAGRHQRQRDGVAAGQQAGAEPEAEHQQRRHVDRVEDREEGNHAAADVSGRQPEPAQRPGGEDDPAGTRGREQAGRGDTRHRDEEALAPAHDAPEHGAEEDDVARVGEDLGARGDAQPRHVAAADPPPLGCGARQLRHHEHGEPGGRRADAEDDDHPPRRRVAGRRGGARFGIAIGAGGRHLSVADAPTVRWR
jgi:hypothetical protein